MSGADITNLVVGIIQFVTFLNGHPHHDGSIAAAVAGSLVIAGVMGAVRVLTRAARREAAGQFAADGPPVRL